ncbi:MAG: PocR ligand-binding domain-containing protein [Elusimicrobiales bacterium]|nr:PocR ligand-binding domain-containing protein [Elusimicrobiales bacterium]
MDSQRKIKDLSRLKRRLAALLAAVFILVIGGALLYYRHYSRHIELAEYDLVASIGRGKVRQLTDWRAGRLAQARALLDSPVLGIYLRRLAAAPGDKANSDLVRLRLESFARNNGLAGVALTDQAGGVLVAAGKRPWENCPEIRRLLKDPAVLRGPLLSDIHRDASGKSEIQVVAKAPGNLFLVASLDPYSYLYPLIQSWPTVSPSGETLLVKLEDGRILFLNELRHKKNTALNFSLPADTAELPAAAAVKGETGIRRGRDYRGVPVLAYTARVPGTGWSIVSKVDESEVFSELRVISALLLLLVLALLGASGGGAFLLFRLQAAEYAKAYDDLAREADAKLRERDEVFGQFLEHSPVYVFFKDEQLRTMHLSRNFEAWLGRPLAELLGKSMAELFPPELAKGMVEDDKRVLAEGKEIAVEEELGGRRYRTIKFPLKLPGRPACLAGYTIDITEQEKAKQDLLERAVELKEAQRLARLGNWTLDHATKELRWSEEIFRIFELDPAQFGASYEAFLSAIHPEDRAAVDAAYTRSLADHTPYKITHRLLLRDGRIKYVTECCETFFDAQGHPVISVGTVQDLTELKVAEEALRTSEAEVRLKLNSLLAAEGEMEGLELGDVLDVPELQAIMNDFYRLTRIGIGIIDLKGKVLVATGWQEICTKFHRVNPETARNCLESDLLLSKGVEQGKCKTYRCKNNLRDIATPIIVGGKHLGNLFLGQFLYADEPQDPELFRRQALRYGFEEKEYMAAYENLPRFSREQVETVMRFYIKFSELVSALSYGKIKLARALAQSRQAQLAKESLNLALADKNQELENFLYITTHDLRTPLVNIQGFSQNVAGYVREITQLLSAGPENSDRIKRLTGEKIPEALAFVQDGSRKMESLISALLKVSRAGRVELKPESNDMGLMLKKILDAMRFQLDEAGAEVAVERPLPACLADPGALSQIFSNLLDNAVKYRSPGRPLRVRVTGGARDGFSVYEVADNGLGMEPRELERLWSVFAKPASARAQGEGIGLPMVKRMIERSGGIITAESKAGEGSVFRVELPAPGGGK